MKRDPVFFRGCLLGGAIGDALGWPVEFMSVNDIERRYGPGGIQDLQLSSSGKAEITDDTQMTIFTAEGILSAEAADIKKEAADPTMAVYFAYQRWLLTQGYPRVEEYAWCYDGWLLGEKELYAKRAPGNTCLTALLSRKRGTMEEPLNNSKGCGGVMRVAPAGLYYPKERAFRMAAEFAAITHGHPSGYLSAGALAYLIALIVEGKDLEAAAIETLTELKGYNKHEECTQIIEQALHLSKSSLSVIEAIQMIGKGWVGEEALGIALYCSLKHQDDFKMALLSSVNHGGDSDSTGAITGNILGAYLGLNKIHAGWVEKVELKEVLMKIADDLLVK